MARDEEREGILVEGVADGAVGFGSFDFFSNFFVGRGFSERNFYCRLEDIFLERGELAEVERGEGSFFFCLIGGEPGEDLFLEMGVGGVESERTGSGRDLDFFDGSFGEDEMNREGLLEQAFLREIILRGGEHVHS